MKELPKVFANPLNKNISNNSTRSYSKLEEEVKENKKDDAIIREKIDKIFKSEGNIYSIDCQIKFINRETKYTIIGKTSNHLVAKNQNLIPIKDIYDINLA